MESLLQQLKKRNNSNYILIIIILLSVLSCTSIKTKNDIANEYFLLGNHYYDIAQFEKAVIFYKKSIDFNPDSENTILNLIICYQKMQSLDNAEIYIYKFYKKRYSEFNKKLFLLLGNNFYLKQNYERAVKVYNEYLKLYPDDSNCLFNLGLSYLKLSDHEKAIKFFLEAYKNKNDHIPALYNIADYYYSIKDYSKSVYYLNILEKIDSQNPDLFYKLGEIEFLIQEYELSKNHLLQAVKLDDDNNDYYILLARVYSKGFNNKAKTIEFIEKALKNEFKEINTIYSYPEFKILIELEEFKKILKDYKLK